MTDKEKKNKIADILLDFYDEYDSNVINRPMIPNIYAGKILNSLQEEPVSNDLEEAADKFVKSYTKGGTKQSWLKEGYIAGAQWQKTNLWKPADGDDLPDIDKEVIALLDSGKVVFAHRPPEFWDGKDFVTGKVTRNYPKTYDKGGWNISNIVYWLDVKLPKEIEL